MTRAGRDPIRPTTTVQGIPCPDAFAGESGPRFTSGDIVAVPYDVWFANDHWYADVEAPGIAGASYSPFLRLAVARYQADSLDGLRLSGASRGRTGAAVTRPHPDPHPRGGHAHRPAGRYRPSRCRAKHCRGVDRKADAPPTPSSPASPTPVTCLAGPASAAPPVHVRFGGQRSPAHRRQRPPDRIRRSGTLSTDAPPPAAHPELTQRTVFVDIIPLG